MGCVGNYSVSNFANYCSFPTSFPLSFNCRNQFRDLRIRLKIRSRIRRLLIIANSLLYLYWSLFV
ncbi:LOW QUALITY PROTEIN: uncharacterized protein LOC110230349 [Arabidopsis lyrata subsp. lyrata]|uniref:LOW QUALITY PROTEIN: uncharacterized protein LOC110230349 n=1 Tax=Arabidopsis lyrata subsp. lyrata TaxID=81972 RepID=UPI000A29E87D|nr:LOW QUALITY PROTEIN: uncharacterized protein LOC110230349 [Arabidopsis lyrata subsp. lyrata]|eukprot:XP_020888641.1 LOW QUALITY PROTEIN: uncharacterized protein LOC110230349 [Arabidopsis lyrata subsp. lyrata]